jgi:hypothetical protein
LRCGTLVSRILKLPKMPFAPLLMAFLEAENTWKKPVIK